jgi:hypothetical protein
VHALESTLGFGTPLALAPAEHRRDGIRHLCG